MHTPAGEDELRHLSQQALQRILEEHGVWLDAQQTGAAPKGRQADLGRTDLSGMDLSGARLHKAGLQKANLAGADLRGAILREADLSGANLLRTNLQDADLRDADLSDTGILLASQLAGANLAGAILPGNGPRFEGLNAVGEISKNARHVFLLILTACFYTLLTIATTTDPLLLTNTASFALPIIGSQIAIASYYWMAPLVLLGMYLYFHLYLQLLWDSLAGLPAVFPDGMRLDKRAYPWMLTSLVSRRMAWLRRERPPFSGLQAAISITTAWWIVPAVLIAVWLRYLVRHDWYGTSLHIIVCTLAIYAGIRFYHAANATLGRQPQAPGPKALHAGLRSCGRIGATLGIAVVFLVVSFGAIQGVRHEEELPAGGVRLWVPHLLEGLGISPFADFFEQDISAKPDRWTEEQGIKTVKGARLKAANLTHAQARRAFLVNADLRGANLAFADLREADLRGADLRNARLRAAKLHKADLSDAYLRGAGLQQVDLSGFNLGQKDLRGVSFRKANVQDVKWDNANLQGADLREVTGLDPEALRRARNWVLADYSPDLLAELGLPPDHGERLQKRDLHGLSVKDANLTNARLRGFNLRGASLEGAGLSWTDLSGADLRGANLQGARFYKTDLRGAKLQDADLRGASLNISKPYFIGANLQNADLSSATSMSTSFEGVDLRGANLEGMQTNDCWWQIEGAILDERTRLPQKCAKAP